jgi:hypothetical protein
MQARIRPSACRVEITEHEGEQLRILIFEDAGSNVSIGPFTPKGWETMLAGLHDPDDAAARADARSRLITPPGPQLN